MDHRPVRWLLATALSAACVPLLVGTARAQAIFTGNGAAASLDCFGGQALVRGSGNRLSIGGACRSLSINGNGNTVAINLAPGGPVRVNGNGNRVLYHYSAGPPKAQTSGADNQVLPDPRPASLATVLAPPPPLVVTGSSPVDLACGGRDVLIDGVGLRTVLRGGCRSLRIEGRSNMITAELLPGAPVLIGGPAIILNYVLVAEGPAPNVRVTRGLRATQIQHFGESQLSLPTAH